MFVDCDLAVGMWTKKKENIKVIRKYPSFMKSTQSISFAQNVYKQLFIHGTHFTQLKVVLFDGFVCICINRTEFPCVFSTKLPAAFYSASNCNESYLMVYWMKCGPTLTASSWLWETHSNTQFDCFVTNFIIFDDL